MTIQTGCCGDSGHSRLSMGSIDDRIRTLQAAFPVLEMPQGSDLPEEILDEIISIFSDGDFLHLPLDQQCTFLDFIQDVYQRTYHSSAPMTAAAVERIFQFHASNDLVPFHRLCKTYDFLYFLYWCAAVSIEQQRGFDTGAVIPFSRYLSRRFGPSVSPGVARRDGPLRLCYLAQFAYDGQGNALALVAETLLASLKQHYPGDYELFIYAWMHKTPEFVERVRSLGITVRTFDAIHYSKQELSRMRGALGDDRLDIVMTDMNSAVPHYLFHRRVAPVQIFYQLGLPFWQAEGVDGVFQGWQISPAVLGLESDKCYDVPTPKSAPNINPPVDLTKVERERNRFPASRQIIGSYGRLVKVTPAYLEIVRSILETHSDVIAVFGGTGNALPILEFIRNNRLENRLFVHNEFVDGHVWGRFLDVFLDTFPLTGAYSCREVLAKGKPIVHMLSGEMPNLNSFLDSELQATTADDYVGHVSRLLGDPGAYRRSARRALDIARKDADTSAFATTFHTALQKVIGR